MKPLAIDLFCGLGGWTEGLLAEGWDVIGFDIERHAYGEHRYPSRLVLQDVRTIHGSQFRNASLIVASPPCQEFSYMAMPWTRAKKIAAEYRDGTRDRAQLTALFDACFRIQREAIEAAGHFIPMVVENVRGANPWVGRSRWSYGSFHLWGDVPALMPITFKVTKVPGMGAGWRPPGHPDHRPGLAFNTHTERAMVADESVKVGGPRGDDWFTHHNRPEFEDRATKNSGGLWFNVAHNTTSGKGKNPVHALEGRKSTKGGSWFGEYTPAEDGVKQGGDWFDDPTSMSRRSSSKSPARKAASAAIAKIPEALARHIARVYFPR